MFKRTTGVLVRNLEAAYASGAPPAIVKRASPYHWASACHVLWEAGRIDIAEYAARWLQPQYPELTYLTTLVALFDAMPRHPPALLAFHDDPKADIQVVRRPDCDKVLLCFCGMGGTLGHPVNFIHQWLGRLPASLVYLRDFRDLSGARGFPTLGPDRSRAVTALRRIADEIGGRQIYTLGVSLGGYAALHYGLALGAIGVLNLAGATDLTPDFIDKVDPIPPAYLNIRRLFPDYAVTLRDAYASASPTPRVLLAYSAGYPRDRRYAERMAGLPNVKLIAIDFAQHNVVDPLVRSGEFQPLLQRLLSIEK